MKLVVKSVSTQIPAAARSAGAADEGLMGKYMDAHQSDTCDTYRPTNW